MDGFDSQSIFFSDPMLDAGTDNNEKSSARKQFRNFLREFHEGNFNYKYRNALKLNYNQGNYYVDVNLEDLAAYDETLAEKVYKEPTEYLPVFEEAAKKVADEVTTPRPEDEKVVQDIQVLLSSEGNATTLRHVKSTEVSRIVKINGIVISASYIKSKASKIAIKCRNCKDTKSDIIIKPGLEGYMFPRKCAAENNGPNPCPLDPYFIDPDKCKCVDFQTIKLQELTESVPQGEMPRHLQMYCERYLCDRVMPGNKVVVLGIYCIKKVNKTNRSGSKENSSTGVRMPYLRVLGISRDDDESGTSIHPTYTAQEEEEFIRLASQPDIYERIARSVAPSIYGAEDMKKAIACLLFGGSRKRLPDGLCRRGDINVLMLGDPGTAKSQLLKFVERVAPIGIYTSGKGSSAAGLTASVNRDPATRNFVMEGGAMVLADGGVVCIDEFDKMREDDRVAIHEAMEQQTISIAKAGITTTLNTRCSILAAANPVKGTWEDDSQTDDNINFMPTILSRFDMIFIVKDEHDVKRDDKLSKHIISLHMNAGQITEEHVEGELPLKFFKKYIHYCRRKIGPRLSEEAGEKLKNHYVMMRTSCSDLERDADKRSSINITVRQLEAVVRISEAIAKMKLKKFAEEDEVDEALRLFQVSTLSAVDTGSLAGCEGFQRKEDVENQHKIEIKLKQRFPVGSSVAYQDIVNEFVNRYSFPDTLVKKVVQLMVRRNELQRRNNNKLLYRLQ